MFIALPTNPKHYTSHCLCVYLGIHRPALFDDGIKARCVCVVLAAGCARCVRGMWCSVSWRIRHSGGERACHHRTLRSTKEFIGQVICRNYKKYTDGLNLTHTPWSHNRRS